MHGATRIATAFGPATRAIAIVLVSLLVAMTRRGATDAVPRTITPRPDRVLVTNRFARVDVRLPACERYWFDASMHGELWLWPTIGPMLAAAAIDRTAWMDAICEGYRTRWTP